jgi:hypothetical protein
MRQMISGLVAAVALVAASAAPAMACGGLFQGSCSPCGQQAYVSPCAQAYAPAPVYSYERLPDPVQQYYYADQGPTYSGPGNFAPYPSYQESAVSGWDAYRRPYYYGYDGGRYANAANHRYDGAPYADGPAMYSYRAHPHYRPYYARPHYHFPARHYGYAPRHYGYAHRYGVPHRYGYGYREHVLRRYY